MKENHMIALYFATLLILLVGVLVFRQEIDGDLMQLAGLCK